MIFGEVGSGSPPVTLSGVGGGCDVVVVGVGFVEEA
jgi:hypothetical protein